jgi:transcriptional regulator with XRE-family HTH domain
VSDKEEYVKELKRIRKEDIGFTQVEMAGVMGITSRTISNYETGVIIPPMSYYLSLQRIRDFRREKQAIKNTALQAAV